jgi:hypothetical protein
MKEQLPKFLQYFFPIPSIISLFVFLLFLFLTAVASSVTNKLTFYIFILITIVSFVALIAKSIADGKMKKFRNGINPLYLVKKYPNNLEGQINDLLNQKYEVKEKTVATAHVEKKPYFSLITAIFLALCGILPGAIYVIWYLMQPKDVVLLDINSQSKLE